ncbi:acid protease [Coniophora puteana RWD-64-598 SS2]|uniref:Acid protease n=1 Tax=Coniophora puteana (strain RWD-64-598) TaxID=741705 RepID=A0A5M3MNS5_CONPW|nr:acid protease [Coniophora puteana RWD-64-598 SS2]EIW80819.1 acid protease [Coniophora puteana RWD-64-598 SS2]
MFPSKALLSLCLLATAAAASPVKRDNKSTLSFATRFKQLDQGKTIAEVDRARAAALQGGAKGKRDGTVSVTNAQVTYTASVGVGSPATQYTLLIDTGSSNTWVGADKEYTPSSSAKDTGNTVEVSYGSGSFSGEEYTDTVTLGDGLVIKNQSIGVASFAQGFQGVDGILGVGPTDLTSGTVSSEDTVPTVTDNLYSAGTINTEVLGIYYAPAAGSDSTGELSFGRVDTSKTTGDVAYVPITSMAPASQYWGIDQSISYGSTSILDKTAGVVDTGTTLVLIASDAFQAYQKATGATADSATGLLKVTSAQYSKLEDLNFEIGGTKYPLSANGQIFPRSLNSAIGGDADSIYLIVSDIGTQSGQGLDFINGYAFLERYYSVYDTTNSQVGFATTANTDATSN